MLRVPFQAGRHGQQVRLGPSPTDDHASQPRPPFRQGAGLVEHQVRGLPEGLQGRGIPHQHTLPGGRANPHHDGHRGGQAQRAGTGDHQQGHRGPPGLGQTATQPPPAQEGQQGQGEDHGYKHGADPIGQILGGGLGALGLGHHGRHACQLGFSPYRQDLHFQDGAMDHGARHQVITRGFGYGQGFPGQHRLVHFRLTSTHAPIGWHRLARKHAGLIAPLQDGDRNLQDGSVSLHPQGRGRRQRQQRPKGIGRTGLGPGLQIFPGEQEGHQRSGGFKAELVGAAPPFFQGEAPGDARTQGDERIHGSLPVPRLASRPPEETPPRAEHHRRGQQELDPTGQVPADPRKHHRQHGRREHQGEDHPATRRCQVSALGGQGFRLDLGEPIPRLLDLGGHGFKGRIAFHRHGGSGQVHGNGRDPSGGKERLLHVVDAGCAGHARYAVGLLAHMASWRGTQTGLSIS